MTVRLCSVRTYDLISDLIEHALHVTIDVCVGHLRKHAVDEDADAKLEILMYIGCKQCDKRQERKGKHTIP